MSTATLDGSLVDQLIARKTELVAELETLLAERKAARSAVDPATLDDEARELSAQYTDVWAYKPDNADVSYSQTIIDKIDELKANTEAVAPKVQIEGLNELVASLIASQKTMMEAITHNNARRA